LLRTASLSFLSLVAADEGHLEVAVSLAIEGRTVMAEFGLQETPQASLAPIALGYALGQRGDLTEAQTELENGLSARRRLPGLSPWPTLIGLTALASVRSARGDRGGAREVLAEARATLEPFGDDTGILTELVERQEHELRVRKRRDGALDRELTKRELDVLGLLDGELSTRQIAESLYVAPSTVRTQIKSIYRKLGVSSRGEAVEEAHVRGLI
jgi:LuxR family transcriptional regulator, maltose regulon positive regulatory protein